MVLFSQLDTFVRMGGYARIVWPAFAVGLGLLFTNAFYVYAQFRRVKKTLANAERVPHESGA